MMPTSSQCSNCSFRMALNVHEPLPTANPPSPARSTPRRAVKETLASPRRVGYQSARDEERGAKDEGTVEPGNEGYAVASFGCFTPSSQRTRRRYRVLPSPCPLRPFSFRRVSEYLAQGKGVGERGLEFAWGIEYLTSSPCPSSHAARKCVALGSRIAARDEGTLAVGRCESGRTTSGKVTPNSRRTQGPLGDLCVLCVPYLGLGRPHGLRYSPPPPAHSSSAAKAGP